MPPNDPGDRRPQPIISSRILPVQPTPIRIARPAHQQLADRLVTYLERLASASTQTAAVRTAYRNRLAEPARTARPEPVAERPVDAERGRDR